MKIEKTICDICGVECNGFAHVILNKADGEVLGINDFCPRCYSKIVQNVMKEREKVKENDRRET